ncbi:MAG: helix-hairpin-helix domain-containing protein [Gemmatimonadales bacterium]
MAARDERRAVLLLALAAAAGGVARVERAPEAPPGASAIAPELRGADVARQAALSRRAEALARPLGPGERVDVDTAAADELARLPRVGPKLARRIVEERDARGPFGGLAGLGRVPGIGPALLAGLQRSAIFSGVPRAGALAVVSPAPGGPARPAASGGSGTCGPLPLPLNTASAVELDCLKGVGPALAGRIVADRAARGPYPGVEDLDRVPGIGKRLVERLRPFLRAP